MLRGKIDRWGRGLCERMTETAQRGRRDGDRQTDRVGVCERGE